MLNGRVVGQIDEQYGPVYGAAPAEIIDKELRFFKRDAHGGKDHRKFFVTAGHLSLTGDLSSKLIVRQAVSGENRQLLTAHQRIQAVDDRDAGLNKFRRIIPGIGIDRQAIDVAAL